MKLPFLKSLLLLGGLLLCEGGEAKAQISIPCGDTLHMMSYNIRNGIGMDNVNDLQRTAAVILRYRPDIVAVQEVDSVTLRSDKRYVLGELAQMTHMHPVYAPAIAFSGGKYGIGMLSREKPLGYKYYPLPGREEQRTLLVVEFEQYVYCCTHLSLTPEDQLLSLPVINEVAATIKKPLFIAGDMNAHPDSPFIDALKKSFRVLSAQDCTWPASSPDETLDYIAVRHSDSSQVDLLSTAVICEPKASDHRPVTVTVVLRPSR